MITLCVTHQDGYILKAMRLDLKVGYIQDLSQKSFVILLCLIIVLKHLLYLNIT